MNMQRKKFLALLLSPCIIVSLNSCGSQTTESTPAKDTSSISEDTSLYGDASESNKVLSANYTLSSENTYEISDTLFGIFLEDINFAVDGGLYAELIKNRSFEYGGLANSGAMHGWNTLSDKSSFEIIDGSSSSDSLNEYNTNYALITCKGKEGGIYNTGFLDGIYIEKDASYIASIYIRGIDGYTGSVTLSLKDSKGNIYASATIPEVTDNWSKYETTLTSNSTLSEDVRYCIEIEEGSIATDMVSLMPTDTYKDLPIRKDLGEYLEALNPSFLRFPGGCVIEGRSESSMYSWKDSIGNGLTFDLNSNSTGDVAIRPQGEDIWKGNAANPYYMTYGLGFYEYFKLCEALDALPMPVLNAGMTCPVQSPKYIVYDLDSEEFKQCVQDALDLVEFCKGDSDTYWGSVRCNMGHEEPFALKYICIGNEQWQSEYHEHFEAFATAFEDAAKTNPELYSDIELCVANGTSSGSTEGWEYIDSKDNTITTLVDEHYYESPDWFLTNNKRYDAYDRNSDAKVFLGEYAAKSNTLEAALAEASYMTALERNGDIVEMACYAPLFGNETSTQWDPDLIYFNNNTAFGTADYYVQQLFAQNSGTTYVEGTLVCEEDSEDYNLTGYVGLATWMTSAAFDNLMITDNESEDILYETDFEDVDTLKNDNWSINEGSWLIKGGQLIQTSTGNPYDTNTGDSIYVGDKDWSNYTLTVDATILDGSEGFLIPVCVENTSNNIFWNIGGWGNTVSCLQTVSKNVKSGQVSGTVQNLTLQKNKTYHIKVEVSGNNIKCYLDDKLYIDYTQEQPKDIYASTVMDEDENIIVKLVNTSQNAYNINIDISSFDLSTYKDTALLTVLSGDSLSDANSFEDPKKICPTTTETQTDSLTNFVIEPYSLVIIKI
nr:hypothetical protein [Butyrivibrio sp.]